MKYMIKMKNIYPDVIRKSMPTFDLMFKDQLADYVEQTQRNIERLSDDTGM